MIAIKGLVPLVCLAAAQAYGQSIDYISGTTEITGLSADGRAASARNNGGAIFWSRETGRYRIAADFPNGYSAAFAISGNGRVVAGERQTSGTTAEAFLWSGPGNWQGVGHPPNTDIAAGTGLNWDGSIMSVTASVGLNYTVAARWTRDTGMQVIGPLVGDYWSEAKGISRDGSTIIGTSDGQFSNGFVWTADGGLRRLQRVGSIEHRTAAYGTNHDGSLVVGQTGYFQMSMWRNGQPQLLAPSGEFSSIGYAVNDDGTVVVGSIGFGDQAAAIWTEGRGFEYLSAFLTHHGITVDPSWTLLKCTSVSADGRTFSGQAVNTARERIGFIVTIPSPSGMLVFLGFACVFRRRV